jgi:hypothetical protein
LSDGKAREMVNFLGIGSGKAGTTWAFKRLAMHPELYFPLGKETHYWNHGRHAGDYMRAFKRGELAERCGWKCGEITPTYALLPPERIAALKQVFPAARVFIIARHPAARTMSSLKQFYRRGKIESLVIQTMLDHCNRSIILDHSRYGLILDKWGKHYDVKVLLFDDIRSSPKALLADICRHVGVDETFFVKLPDEIVAPPVHASGGVAPLPEFWRWVVQQTERDIVAVERATNRDLSHWRSPEPIADL